MSRALIEGLASATALTRHRPLRARRAVEVGAGGGAHVAVRPALAVERLRVVPLVVGDRAGGRGGVAQGHLLAAHAHPHLAAGHGDHGHAPAYAAPRHRPQAPRRPHEHRRGHGLRAHVADHPLQQPHVADRPEGLLLAHEQGVGRQPRGLVGLLVAAALDARHALEEPLPARELALVRAEPGEEAVGALVLALRLGAARAAQREPEARLLREAPGALDPPAPAAGERDEGRHVVGERLLRGPAEGGEGVQQAREQVVGGPRPRGDEAVPPRVAQGPRPHVELEDLALGVGEPHVLLPVELQLAARRRLEARVRLRQRGAEDDPLPAAPGGERPVAGQRRVVAQVQQHLVRPLLRHPGQDGLRLDDLPHACEGALAVGPAALQLLALPPVPGDRVPVQAVPPRYVAEVRLGPGGPAHVQLAHHVPLHPRSSRRVPILGRSISSFANMVKMR